jgi:hypothetical protein
MASCQLCALHSRVYIISSRQIYSHFTEEETEAERQSGIRARILGEMHGTLLVDTPDGKMRLCAWDGLSASS